MHYCLIRFLLLFSVFIIFNPFPKMSFAFRDLSIPVREPMCWGAHVGPGKTGNLDTIYLSFGQYKAPLFLLAVNPDTGEMRQFNGPLSLEMGSWGFTIDQENRIYLGSYYHAHLLRFDPLAYIEKLTFELLSSIFSRSMDLEYFVSLQNLG